ncbi:MAG: hypothetical protein OXR73_39140 [Myxococcales bacterium]|nr:hypothetical protein [Myxococcales bacterium]
MAASLEPNAARGLAMAYAALTPSQRHFIIDAVVHDAQLEGVCPSLVLASLLAAEEETEVARHIAEALASLDRTELRSHARTRALVAGDERNGGLAVIRPLHGTFVEVLLLAWTLDRGITHTHFEPLLHDAAAGKCLHRLPGDLAFEEMPVSFAIDLVTAPLWNHHRLHGALPKEIERFADLFSLVDSQEALG